MGLRSVGGGSGVVGDEVIEDADGGEIGVEVGSDGCGFLVAGRVELVAAVDVGDAEVVAAAAELVDVPVGQRTSMGPTAGVGDQPMASSTAKASR
jgi:hypothetical protein